MRIMSFRVMPVAKIIALIYGVLGILYVPELLLSGAKEITLPLGILAPLVFFSVNLHVPVPTHFFSGVMAALAACACYTVSGWLTGTVAVLSFNSVAKFVGGIEASVITKDSLAASRRD
ncbi:MAG TPA: hypothetical protein VMH04_15350 [Candidatus Solibacter sp.]|nr:hypothetical protein [Candidatus Solibacter sp.]